MTTVLITAYQPYDQWEANASWLTLVELVSDLPEQPEVTTRLYPVDFDKVRQQLETDLAADFDVALHLGQAPGEAYIRIEAIGINVAGGRDQRPEEYVPLIDDGPSAYRSQLPLADWARKLRGEGIPAEMSYHAGTYLCNAALYLTHYYAQRDALKTQAAFFHIPLTPSQTVGELSNIPSLPTAESVRALRLILEELK